MFHFWSNQGVPIVFHHRSTVRFKTPPKKQGMPPLEVFDLRKYASATKKSNYSPPSGSKQKFDIDEFLDRRTPRGSAPTSARGFRPSMERSGELSGRGIMIEFVLFC